MFEEVLGESIPSISISVPVYDEDGHFLGYRFHKRCTTLEELRAEMAKLHAQEGEVNNEQVQDNRQVSVDASKVSTHVRRHTIYKSEYGSHEGG